MNVSTRLAKLERRTLEAGLHECPGCRRRLRWEIQPKETEVMVGEPMPEPDHCPVCGVEWPQLIMTFSDAHMPKDFRERKDLMVNPAVAAIVLSPLGYDPVPRAGHGVTWEAI